MSNRVEKCSYWLVLQSLSEAEVVSKWLIVGRVHFCSCKTEVPLCCWFMAGACFWLLGVVLPLHWQFTAEPFAFFLEAGSCPFYTLNPLHPLKYVFGLTLLPPGSRKPHF